MSVVNESLATCPVAHVRTRADGRTLPPMLTFVGTALAFVGITFAAGAPSPLFVQFQQQWGFPSWVLSVAFAIYAITLLVTLLVAGSLSDHIGRRPVIIGALAVEIASMAIFVVAPNIGWIIAARAIQGIATGAVTSTFSAAVVENAPERHKKLGALLASAAPIGGLGLGALATGFAVQFSSTPSLIIFGFLIVLFVFGSLVLIGSPEKVVRRPGALRSLIPRVSVPPAARARFAARVPLLVATWMFAGLILGLAPSIVRGVFGIDSGLLNGILVAVQPIAGAIAALALGRVRARATAALGGAAVIVGVAIVLVAITTGYFPLMFVAGLIGGAGFGAGFSGTLREVAPLANPNQRAELFSALYLVNYLAYGAPALLAGDLIGVVGLVPTVIGYALVTMTVAIIGLAVGLVVVRRATATSSE